MKGKTVVKLETTGLNQTIVPVFPRFLILCCLLIAAGASLSQSASQPARPQTIEPFKGVEGFVPGFSRLSDVRRKFGAPESIEQMPRKEIAGIETEGARIAKYPKYGLYFHVSRSSMNQADPEIQSIIIERPYRGCTSNGLCIGMEKIAALRIIEKDYRIAYNLESSLRLSDRNGGPVAFQVWFASGILVRMRLD